MRLIRKTVFWLHLVAGLSAGLVILILAVTGLIMSFERQVLESTTGISVNASGPALGPEAILAAQADAKPAATAVVFNKDPEKPAIVQFGRGKSVFVDPYTGKLLGEGNVKTKQFFAWVLTVHRWFAQEGDGRKWSGNVIAAATLTFFVIVVSGLWLWFPKRWTRSGLKAITTLQFRLKGRARDWNWHNVFGFWACIPLFFIVLTGLVMAYPWANRLMFQAVGETPPVRNEGGGGGPGGPPAEGGERRQRADGGERRGRGEGGGMREGGDGAPAARPVSLVGLDRGFTAAQEASASWQTISVSVPRGTTAQFSVLDSHRGRPDLRRQLTIDLATSQVLKNEGTESQSLGRKLRTFTRWVHTGEALGWPGQLIMALASVSAIVLIYTGFALSWRRFFKRRKTNANAKAARQTPAVEVM